MSAPEQPAPEPSTTESVFGPRRLALLLPILGAPAGLAIAIVLSLMIAGWHVTHSVVVQAEQTWRPGEALALRASLLDASQVAQPATDVTLELTREGSEPHPLGTFKAKDDGQALVNFVVPKWEPGPASLQLHFSRDGQELTSESIEVNLTRERSRRQGELTVSSSTLNWGDNTESQPDNLRINVRPIGRLLAGFDNTLMVRVTDTDGVPHSGPVRVSLLEGEFMGQHGKNPAPLIADTTTSSLGLLTLKGPYASDVLSLDVSVAKLPLGEGAPTDSKTLPDINKRGTEKPTHEHPESNTETRRADKPNKHASVDNAKAPHANEPGQESLAKSQKPDTKTPGAKKSDTSSAAPTTPLGTRKFRMVSFAGAVRLEADPRVIAIPSELCLAARALRAKRGIYVDIHGEDGAWVQTFDPPVFGREPPRCIPTRGLTPGPYQAEAYHYVNSPGESAAVTRMWLVEGNSTSPESLIPLIRRQREVVSLPRVEKSFDPELEKNYLTHLEKHRHGLAPEDVEQAQAWLLGTLPIEVLGPPVAHSTRAREELALAARKQTWTSRVRWFLLGGGGGFLLLTCLLIFWSHSQSARELAEAVGRDDIESEVRSAQRALLLRGAALVATMALGLVLTVAVLDKLLWSN
ncbi:MAG: hypothetical protein ACPG4T_07610 [Nannocystaceae bacterium]